MRKRRAAFDCLAYPRGSAIEGKAEKKAVGAIESLWEWYGNGSDNHQRNLPSAKADFFENSNIPEYYRKLEKT